MMSTEVLDPVADAPSAPQADLSAAQSIRDALSMDEFEPEPQGWQLYTTQKFVGRTALMAYAVAVTLVGLAPLLFRGPWIPVFLAPEMLVYGAPIAFTGAWLEWNAHPEPDLQAKRTWRGRIATLALVYLGMLAVAGVFHLFWVTVVSHK
jgi:hypothetical protein